MSRATPSNQHYTEDDISLREKVANALIAKGKELATLGRPRESVDVYDEIVRKFADEPTGVLRERVAEALVSKGDVLASVGRSEDAITVYDQAIKLSSGAGEPYLEAQIDYLPIEDLGDAVEMEDELIPITSIEVSLPEDAQSNDELAEQIGDQGDSESLERVAMSMLDKGDKLSSLDMAEDALAVYSDIVHIFGDLDDPALYEHVAAALLAKGYRLGDLQRHEEEIGIYDQVLERFGNADEPSLKEYVSKAMIAKGIRLGDLGKLDESTDTSKMLP